MKEIKKGLEWSTCKKKRRYRDEHEANYYRRKCETERGKKLDYYWCPYCKGFHLTSVETTYAGMLYEKVYGSIAAV